MIKCHIKSRLHIYLLSVILLMSSSLLHAETAKNDTPKVPFIHSVGMKKYQSHCASCHGKWADGTNNGPPLIHPYYKPSHHGDGAFYRAALKGVFQHHWKFGPMPPVAGVTKEDMDKVIPFIRWLQQDRGLY